MNTHEFLEHLQSLDIKLTVEGDRLRINAPKNGLTPALKTELANRKAELLAFLQQANEQTAIPLVSRAESLPLSFTQERLWFIDQLTPNLPTYNILMAYRLRGVFDEQVLDASLQTLIQRHESLRTTFILENGQARQQIHPTLKTHLVRVDLTSAPDPEAQAQEYAIVDSLKPYQLTTLPLFRVSLLRLNKQEYILLLNIHHIISDGWSHPIFLRDLFSFYEAMLHHRPAHLPELPLQYPDYAVWKREQLQGELLAQQLTYWRKKLSGNPALLELPTDYPRPPVQTFDGDTHFFTLPRPLVEQVKTFSQQAGATMFMTLLTAFKVLLYRYSGQHDVVLGSFVANRPRGELEELIGFFVNMIVLRTDLTGDPTFAEALKRVRQTTLEAFTYQEVPFEKLVEDLQPKRNLGYTPFTQITFVLQNVPSLPTSMAWLDISPVAVPNKTAKFDLAIYLTEEKNGEISGYIEFNRALFHYDTVARLMSHFQTVLADGLARPSLPISQLTVMPPPEIQKLLVTWNETQTDYPLDHYIINDYFAAQVSQTPESIAILAPEHVTQPRLTYRELDERSNQVAHYLQSLGVGPHQVVGICLERIPDMMVGLWGILKAGGTYIPLDPAFPPERLAFMVADAEIGLILTQERLLKVVPTQVSKPTQLICLDRDWPTIVQYPTTAVIANLTPDNLAYILYTSGSTGKPKGVQISHRALINFLLSMQETPGLSPTDRLLAVTTLSFDISMLELYLPLITGAQIVLASQTVTTDGAQLVRWLHDYHITIMQATPATWRMMLETSWTGTPGLKILCGGEAMSTELAERLLPKAASLWNVYGPTETTIWSTLHPVITLPSSSTVSIGRPIANTQIYILDANLQPVPIGVVGDLYIGGDGVAQGYFNRPELTAERFLPNPFDPQKRVYKTGDLARYLPDGNIEFLGRIDHQVKIRGFRIELGDIEAALMQHNQVKEAVVVAREDTPGDKRLVAYMVLSQTPAPTTAEWRNFLQEKLPPYMIPAAFMMLEALPLTPNGKVDRRALPAPEFQGHDTAQTYVAPRNELEIQLTQIWEQVLKIHPISIRDSFFDLGGHSILAVKLVSLIKREFGQDIPLATLFRAPTIAQLAELVQQQGWTSHWVSLVPIQTQGKKRPFFCVHGAGGNVLGLRNLVKYLGYDQPIYGLQSFGLDGIEVPPSRIEEMASRYIAEIRTVQAYGPYIIGGQSAGGVVALEIAQQLVAQGDEVAVLIMIDTDNPTRQKIANPNVIKDKANFHWKNISQGGSNYIKRRMNARFDRTRRRIGLKLSHSIKQFYTWLNQPLPYSFRYLYIQAIVMEAFRNYQPKPFTRPMVYFRATQTFQAYTEDVYGQSREWEEIALGGIQTYDILGEHRLHEEPFVGMLAEKLKLVLDRAQV